MQSCRPKEGIISLVLVIALTFIILGFPLGQYQYAYSQSSENNPTVKAAVMEVDLTNIHPSPSHLKAGSKFEILATVVYISSSESWTNTSNYDSLLPNREGAAG